LLAEARVSPLLLYLINILGKNLEEKMGKVEAKVEVYLKSGQKFTYIITATTGEELMSKAREHMYAIFQTGYRHACGKEFVWYGKHWIDKIKVIGIDHFSNYPDMASGT